MLTIGFVTMVMGGWQALRQHDLKLLLAFGTVSQLGFIFLLVGSGEPKLVFGGLAMLVGHALFKATLFLVVGAIDHETGTRDLRRLSGLRRSMPTAVLDRNRGVVSMAAVPLSLVSPPRRPHSTVCSGPGPSTWPSPPAPPSLTVAYTGRFLIGAFGSHQLDHEPAGPDHPVPSNALVWAPLVLAAGGLGLGVFPSAVAPAFEAATAAVGATGSGKLVIWPGWVAALGWSLVSLSLGLLMVRWRSFLDRAIESVARVSQRMPTADGAFRRSVAGLLTFADRSSTTIQSGSLPRYIAIILLVATILPATALRGVGLDVGPMRAGGLVELILGVLIVAAAVTLLFTKRRFAAVLLLGGVGYGVAGLFAVFGGADLSVTQLLVETLAVALFALVLRHLPATFSPTRFANPMRVVVAGAVTVFVFLGGLAAFSARVEAPVSDQLVARSIPEAQGANVVNVILVDFRGFDTLGEITVLATATLGVAGLVLPVLRRRREST